jgi:chemotaxis protein methyltransferase CheR
MVSDAAIVNQDEVSAEIPEEVLSSPALLFLYYRIEHILGIRTKSEALKNLNEYFEKTCGSTFIENPASYERLLTSREHIFNISKFLTVNETYFFREGEHFKLLIDLMPQFTGLNRPVKICSAAVSTGCEAYSIAMLFDYYIKNGLKIDFAIDAFDVNLEAIETAKKARYTVSAIRDNASYWRYILDSYLIHDNGEYVVTPEIQSKVRFFPHNIMRGIENQYDIIFFRNSLIYFSTKNRLNVINNLADSLLHNGLLFLGASETSSVKHPLFLNCCSSDAFYFKKTGGEQIPLLSEWKSNNIPVQNEPANKRKISEKKSVHLNTEHSQTQKCAPLSINSSEITGILKLEEGKQNAQNILDTLNKGNTDSISGSCLAAAVLYYLHTQDLNAADKILLHIEKSNSDVYTKFLRGEYYYLLKQGEEALKYFQEAASNDKFFWPAFYKIASLSAEGNKASYEYKIKKAIESIEQPQKAESDERNYECFMGGFSQDYFLRILKKKLT